MSKTNTQLRAGHIRIGDMLLKITWETASTSDGAGPRIVECVLSLTSRGLPWDNDTEKVAARFAELAASMQSSLNQEVSRESE